jgi:hypothetical protein
MHLPINVKSPNNISKWQVGFNSAFKGLTASGFTLKRGGNSAVGRGETTTNNAATTTLQGKTRGC